MTFTDEEERREALGLGGGKTLDDYVLDDEPETKILRVTAEHIGRAGKGAFSCPFALAAQDLFSWTASLTVVGPTGSRPGNILMMHAGRQEYWDLDEAGSQAVRYYDVTGEMEPGGYVITKREEAWAVSG
jgi:hypothetical protein